MPAKEPLQKTLFIDIETYPDEITAWVKNRHDVVVVDFVKMWRLAAFAYLMIEGDRAIQRHGYVVDGKKGSERSLVRDIRNLFDWADLVVAHNANFDIGKMRAKFIEYKFDPPSNYRGFCTYYATRSMGFSSKKLDDLGQFLGFGRKLPTLGKDTWRGACEGDIEASKLLAEYNLNDVDLLVELYKRIRPHADREHRPVISGIVPDDAPGDGLKGLTEKQLLVRQRWIEKNAKKK